MGNTGGLHGGVGFVSSDQLSGHDHANCQAPPFMFRSRVGERPCPRTARLTTIVTLLTSEPRRCGVTSKRQRIVVVAIAVLTLVILRTRDPFRSRRVARHSNRSSSPSPTEDHRPQPSSTSGPMPDPTTSQPSMSAPATVPATGNAPLPIDFDATVVGVETPEADALEQARAVICDDIEDQPISIPLEAPEADTLDQHRDVILDDELRAGDVSYRSRWPT
jgi:hypothetical protein